MTPEILAKIMGIIAKTGDRVIVIDPKSGIPFALMNLDQYEKLTTAPKGPVLAGVDPVPFKEYNKTAIGQGERSGAGQSLTAPPASGMIDPALAPPWAIKKNVVTDEWGGDEAAEEDKFYMEPVE